MLKVSILRYLAISEIFDHILNIFDKYCNFKLRSIYNLKIKVQKNMNFFGYFVYLPKWHQIHD